MAWKHIFWNDAFFSTGRDNWEDELAGKIFVEIQFSICCTFRDFDKWPALYKMWDVRLKHIFLEILKFVKKGASDGAAGAKNSPRINSMIIIDNEKPYLAVTMCDVNEMPILEIPESLDDLQFFGDISHMV